MRAACTTGRQPVDDLNSESQQAGILLYLGGNHEKEMRCHCDCSYVFNLRYRASTGQSAGACNEKRAAAWCVRR
jgi:hypothetical protein